MRKYKSYINEYRNRNFVKVGEEYAKEIDLEKLDYYINKYCSNFSWDDTPIYRGVDIFSVDGLKDLMLFNPKAIERKSANTDNYYTWLVDSSPEWEKYPKRSKSLICSNSISIASGFGNKTYRVIPFNDAKIAISNREDFWLSFREIFKKEFDISFNLDTFNNILSGMYYIVFKEQKFGNPNNINDFLSNYNKMSKILNNMSDKELLKSIKRTKNNTYYFIKNIKYDILLKIIRKITNIDDVYSIMSPERNEFQLLDYNIYKTSRLKNVEIWTDSKALFIDTDKEFLYSHKNKQ